MACFWQDNELTTEDCGGGGDWVNITTLLDDFDLFMQDGFSMVGDGFTLNRATERAIYQSTLRLRTKSGSAIVVADARVTVESYQELHVAGSTIDPGIYPSRVYFVDVETDAQEQLYNMNGYPALGWDPEQTSFSDLYPSGRTAKQITVTSAEGPTTVRYSATGRFIVEVLLG